jgi:hypothetical protein
VWAVGVAGDIDVVVRIDRDRTRVLGSASGDMRSEEQGRAGWVQFGDKDI